MTLKNVCNVYTKQSLMPINKFFFTLLDLSFS